MPMNIEDYEIIRRMIDERVSEIQVTREDFNSLRRAVEELAEAQRNTEARLSRLEKIVEELTEAQRGAEARLSRLEKIVEELAEAQKSLAEAQKSLAEAQKNTEKEIQTLTKTVKKTQKEIGGLSHTVGYYLEDRAIKSLPRLMKGLNIEIISAGRRFFEIDGEEIQLNIFAEGKRDGEEIIVVGEAKTELSKRHIDRFIRRVDKKLRKEIRRGDIIPLMVSYSIRPSVEMYAKEKGVIIFHSHELDLL